MDTSITGATCMHSVNLGCIIPKSRKLYSSKLEIYREFQVFLRKGGCKPHRLIQATDIFRARFIYFAILLFIIISLISTSSTKAEEVDIRKLTGIPVLSDEIESFVLAKDRLISGIISSLRHLENWEDFESLPENKALAILYRKPIVNFFAPYLYRHRHIAASAGWWGGGWNYDTIEEANKAATRQCKGNCILFMSNSSAQLPDELVKEYISIKEKYIQEQISLLEKADKITLLDRALEAPDARTSSKLLLGAPQPINIDYPDHQQDYASACFDHIFQALLPVDNLQKDYVHKLAQIVNRGLYDPYDRSVNTVLDFTTARPGRIMTQMARFAAHYHFRVDPVIEKKVVLPLNLEEALADEVIEEIWVEGSVRISTSGLPLAVDENVSPLAIKTNKHFYLGVQFRIPDANGGCYVSMPFANNVLDLSACNGSYACAKQAIDTLVDSLRKTLKAEPFLAGDIQDEPFGPGEFGLKREYQPSHVIGDPYYELSTYTIQTWVAENDNPFYSLYNRQKFMGIDEQRAAQPKVLMFLKLNHVLTLSPHKNGTYSEPEAGEVSKFKAALSSAVTTAIQKACADMKSAMEGSACKISSK